MGAGGVGAGEDARGSGSEGSRRGVVVFVVFVVEDRTLVERLLLQLLVELLVLWGVSRMFVSERRKEKLRKERRTFFSRISFAPSNPFDRLFSDSTA